MVERGLRGSKSLLLFQETQVWFLATHNCLEFQLQGINALTWLPLLTSMQVRILTQRYIHINEKNLFLKKRMNIW